MVQNFDPIPLYEVMQELGFEYHTEQTGDAEFHAYFYKTTASSDPGDIPMRPAALTNMPLIDDELGKLSVSFWDLTWNDSKRFCPMNSVSSCPRPMPSVPAACVRLRKNWSKPISTACRQLPWTTSLNSWRGTRGSASSVLKSVRPPCSRLIRP